MSARGAPGEAARKERWSRDLSEHANAFRARFGPGADARLYFSPGRVNLMGAHLDYNGGPVMPAAIDRGTFIAVRPRSGRRVRMASTLGGPMLDTDLSALPRQRAGGWADYPLGVLLRLLSTGLDPGRSAEVCGVDILFGGNLAVGAGLSSSASICVGTAIALDDVWGLGLDRMDLVHAALHAEREFVGVQCGIMDPYAVGLAREGHLLWLDCKDATSAYIPLDSTRLSIAVADTGVRRELAQIAFNERVRQCKAAFEGLRPHQAGATCLRDITLETFLEHGEVLDPAVSRRAEHVIREVARTFAARNALSRGDPTGLGTEMFRAHESLRDLFEVSVPELDQLVESAAECPGVVGARLTGAGFGGCVVILLRSGARAEVEERLSHDFLRRFSVRPTIEVYETDPGPRAI